MLNYKCEMLNEVSPHLEDAISVAACTERSGACGREDERCVCKTLYR